jgi:hypothetical protein
MKTFYEWLAEAYFSFDPAEYNALFNAELGKLSASSSEHRTALARLQSFNWTGYIAASVRNAGYRDEREVAERTHDIVVKLLTQSLFTNYDEERHGPLDLRFKRAVANAIKNIGEKERNRRRSLPTVPISQEFEPGGITADALPDRAVADDGEEKVIEDFRQFVRNRLGELGVAVLDTRLAGQETKSLVGRHDLGTPGRYVVKRIVAEVKALAREYAQRLGDPAFLREIQRAFQREEATVQRRLATGAARR